MIDEIRQVSLELSNLCDQSHKQCPLSVEQVPVVLATDAILKVLSWLWYYGYDGAINFSRYNEPLNDPRLFWLAKWAKEILPKARLCLTTNGRWITSRPCLEEIQSHGFDFLHISLYGTVEEQVQRQHEIISMSSEPSIRPLTMHVEAPLPRHGNPFKPLLDIYDREPKPSSRPCHAPFRDFTINCHGEVTLCCLDWQNRHTFGNVLTDDLDDIVNDLRFVQAHAALSDGRRMRDICRRCGSAR